MSTVVIDCLPSSAEKYRHDCAIVVVDVIRFSTTAVTALAAGRMVHPTDSADSAFTIAQSLTDPILAGELGGNVPYGFHISNSPVQIMALSQVPCGAFTSAHRPIVLVSSSGAKLLMNSVGARHIYLGCLRNLHALTEHLAQRHDKVAILGAGTRGEFRREDQLCCSWIAARLVDKGFSCANAETANYITRWQGVQTDVIRHGKSAQYLRQTGQIHDLEFVLHYQDDVNVVPVLIEGQLVNVVASRKPSCEN